MVIVKGMFVLPCSPINFLFKKSKGVNFVKECPIIISNRWHKIFFKKVSFSWKTAKLDSFVFSYWEKQLAY